MSSHFLGREPNQIAASPVYLPYPDDGGTVNSVQGRAALGVIAEALLLSALGAMVGLSALGWVTGVTCAFVVNAALARGLSRAGVVGLGPADRVTAVRATLVCAVAALTAHSYVHPAPAAPLVALAVVALVLDGVDGWVARRTGTASPLGALFDQEVDAFLILILSVQVARSAGPWVLAIGAARYVFLAAGWLAPWFNASLPPRYWRKVVAATQGIVLTCAAAQVLPSGVNTTALLVALALLTESFGRDVWWLWRRRPVQAGPTVPPGVLEASGAPRADVDPTAART
jgi:phosphatidylglycerophosphate synthase